MENKITLAGNLIDIINNSKQNALRKVNEELIQMYWSIGEYLSKLSETAEYGDSYIETISKEIQIAFPGIKGFNKRGLYRMKQFYETYKENPFLDSYVIEFLDLPNEFRENDLRKALIKNMRDFIMELGKDFTYIDEEYKIQVGGDDFRIDLLFYHRGLCCLVAIELKIGKFKPEYISKLDFYLEALDRQVKKEAENPSVGLLLCASKNDEVVEYSMSRTMSPMMVSEYQLQLPDKAVLQKKLQELVNIPAIE